MKERKEDRKKGQQIKQKKLRKQGRTEEKKGETYWKNG